jgi:ribonuclease VapC
MAEAEACVLPATVYVEFTIVTRARPDSRIWLDATIDMYRAAIRPVDEAVAKLAAEAWGRYGRGSGHPARLNFGDCLSYAVARHLDAPLLFKGDDLARTDIGSAAAP